MLDSQSHAGVAAFFTDYMRLYKLDNLSKITLFEHFSSDLRPMLNEKPLSLIDYLLLEVETDYREAFITREALLARGYPPLPQHPGALRGFSHVLYPTDHPRRGLTGQVAFLVKFSLNVTSATLRGLAVQAMFLCQEIPPHRSMSTSIPEPSGTTLTLRDRVAEHLNLLFRMPRLMDPIGLGFEQYDSIGRWRLSDNGATIDPHGDLDGKSFSTRWLGQRISEPADSALAVRSLAVMQMDG